MKGKHFKAAFISDLHLGSASSEAGQIYKFLKYNDFDEIYLIGDIIDIWRIKKSGFLSRKKAQDHMNVVQRLLKLSKKGTKIYYIYGNHDEFIANFLEDDEGRDLGNITICEKMVYESISGERHLLIHGQQFDLVIRCNPWIAKLGDTGYHILIRLNKIYNYIRRKLGFKYWSLSKYIKVHVKKAIDFINRFETTATRYAKELDCSSVICGHIHHPEVKDIDGIKYVNCGCWTDIANCTAYVEYHDGKMEMINVD